MLLYCTSKLRIGWMNYLRGGISESSTIYWWHIIWTKVAHDYWITHVYNKYNSRSLYVLWMSPIAIESTLPDCHLGDIFRSILSPGPTRGSCQNRFNRIIPDIINGIPDSIFNTSSQTNTPYLRQLSEECDKSV